MSEPAMWNRLQESRGIDLHKAIVLAAFLLLLYLASWGYLRDQPFESMVLSDSSSILINGLAALCIAQRFIFCQQAQLTYLFFGAAAL